jgi:hypothetical protein
VDVSFNPIVLFQKYPFVANDTWDGQATITGGDFEASLEYSGRTVGQQNLLLEFDDKQSGPDQVVLEKCWMAILDHRLFLPLETLEVGVDTVWYAPGMGVVQQFSKIEEALEEGGTEIIWSRRYLMEVDPWDD